MEQSFLWVWKGRFRVEGYFHATILTYFEYDTKMFILPPSLFGSGNSSLEYKVRVLEGRFSKGVAAVQYS